MISSPSPSVKIQIMGGKVCLRCKDKILLGVVKVIYSEKAIIFCEISTIDLSYVVTVKSMVEILRNFVAFSEYMNFKYNSEQIEIIKICSNI